MIEIRDKHDCTGCRACEQVCPKKCISMKQDSEGFSFPEVDLERCINCSLCERVCPAIQRREGVRPYATFGCKSTNKHTQTVSSSGGVFTEIARYILNQGGHVFGAGFDSDFNVRHIGISDFSEIDSLRRSKYVQSDTGETYSQVKHLLEKGSPVLFCGTPCQVRGLLLFLRRKYDNLISVDFVCHGVPSPKVWSDYLSSMKKKSGQGTIVESVNFRSKKNGGWSKFGIELNFLTASGKQKTLFQHPGRNPYYQLFSQNISLRQSCYKCPAKGFTSESDFTIADFWGLQRVAPEEFDNSGVSLLCVNTEKGESVLPVLNIEKFEVPFEDSAKSNPSIFKSVAEPKSRREFFSTKGRFTLKYIDRFAGTDLKGRLRRRAIEMILKIIKR